MASIAGPRLRDALSLTAIGVVVAIATSLWAVLVPGYTIWPDELGYVRGATYVSQHGFLVPPGELYYTSASQLLQVVMAPLQLVFGGEGSIRAAHGLFALVIASSVAPGWLLARELGLSREASLLAAALVTVTSWLSFAGTITTETLGWPLFLWALLAMVRALARPSDGRDAVVLLAIGLAAFARIQFVVLAVVLVVAIALEALAARRSSRRVVREHRVVLGVAALVVLVGLAGLAAGKIGSPLGAYRDVVDQSALGVDQVPFARDHLVYLLLATGVVPVILAGAWLVPALRGARDRSRSAFAAVTVVLAVAVVAQVGVFGAGFLNGSVGGRYVFYLAVPAFLILLLCVEERGPGARALALSAAVAALITATVDVDTLETAVRAPEAGSGGPRSVDGSFLGVPHAGPLLILAVVLAGGAAWLLVARFAARTALALAGAALLLLGAGSAALRMHSILTEARAKDVVAQQDWIDGTGVPPESVALLLGPCPLWRRPSSRSRAMPSSTARRPRHGCFQKARATTSASCKQ